MKLLVTSSTFPVSESDKVPSFVREQVIELKRAFRECDIVVHAPHNAYSNTVAIDEANSEYRIKRYHYFYPFSWERLTGRGIMPALKENRWLFFQIPFLFFFQFFSLLLLVRKEKPDLLYAHWFTPQALVMFIVSKLTKVPFVFTTHASDVSVLKPLPLSKYIVRWICRNAKAYSAVSKRTADKLAYFFAGASDEAILLSKLHLIPMGVKTSVQRSDSNYVVNLREQYQLDNDKKTLLFIGRLAEKKGVSYLLRAISKLPDRYAAQLNIVIAGDGQLKAELEQLCQTLGLNKVVFTGYVTGKHKQALLEIADLTCFPSIIDSAGDAEGFPVAIMESLAVGKLVLASDVTGAEDVLQERKAGFIFPQKNIGALCNVLKASLDLDEYSSEKIQLNAVELAKSFDWSAITQEHYNKLIK